MNNKWTLIIHVEDDGMDSGCIHNILQECTNHGKILKVATVQPGHENDLMHMAEDIKPQEGKC